MITKVAGGKIVTPQGIKKGNIYIKDDKISMISTKDLKTENYIDATGCYVFPGIIDAHVHFDLQQGEFHTSGTIDTETKMALSSGITTVIDFIPFEKEEFDKMNRFVNFSYHKMIKDFDEAYIKKYMKVGINSFKIFTTYSDLMMDEGNIPHLFGILKQHNATAMVHCENDALIRHNLRMYENSVKNLPLIREPLSELEAVNRICFYALKTGVKLHVAHITLHESIDIIRSYNKKKARITFESCPQYLFLDDSLYQKKDAGLYACNPPLRSSKNTEKMKNMLSSKTINIITTDHCSFQKNLKLGSQGLNIPFGIPSAGYSLLLFLNYFEEKDFTKIPLMMAERPANIFNIQRRGRISKGFHADLTIVREKMRENLSLPHEDSSDYNPYLEMKNKWKIEKTIINGRLAFDNGSFFIRNGVFLRRGK